MNSIFLFALSDVVWQAAIGGIVTIALAWIAYVAGKIKRTGEAVHVLTNSNMGIQLRLASVALRRVATLTSNREDVDAAVLAENAYKEHVAKQRVVDAIPGPPAK